jgi:ArsR family transcriptional regulator
MSHGLAPAEAARLFHALGCEPRVRLLLLLAGRRGGASVGELQAALGLRQPAVSSHLGVLRRVGLATCRRNAQRVLYRLASPAAADVLRLVCGA